MVTFLILHYKTFDETCACVESINSLEPYPGQKTNIVIVDNASNDGTGEMLRKKYDGEPNITVRILDRSRGFSGGNNYGWDTIVQKSEVEQLIVCNNDIEFRQKDFLKHIYRIYNKTQYAVCGPDVYKIVDGKRIKTSPFPSPAVSKKDINLLHELRAWQIRQRESGANLDDSLQSRICRVGLYKAIQERYKRFPLFIWFQCSQKGSRIPIKLIRCVEKIEKALAGCNRIVFQNVQLQGSCLVFSKNYFAQNDKIFTPETFFYYEEVLLYLNCKKSILK